MMKMPMPPILNQAQRDWLQACCISTVAGCALMGQSWNVQAFAERQALASYEFETISAATSIAQPGTQGVFLSDYLLGQNQNPQLDHAASPSYRVNSASLSSTNQVVDQTLLHFREEVEVETGQDNIALNSHLFSSAHQNARIVRVSGPANAYQIQLFGSEIDPSIAISGTSIQFNQGRQRFGATLNVNAPDQWRLQSSYINSSTDPSLSLLDTGKQLNISNWNFSLNRNWLASTLQTEMEFARSQYSELNLLHDEQVSLADSALDSRAEATSAGKLYLPGLNNWRSGIGYRAVGPDFYSLGGSSLPKGSAQTRLFFQTNIKTMGVYLEWLQEEQGKFQDDDALQQTLQRSAINLDYKLRLPSLGYASTLLRDATLSTRFSQATIERPDYLNDDSDSTLLRDINEMNVSLRCSADKWRWAIQYLTTAQNNDFADSGLIDTPSNWRNAFTRFELGLTPNNRMALQMNVQWAQQNEQSAENQYNQRLYEIHASLDLIPETFSLSLQYNYGLNDSNLSAPGSVEADTATQYGNARLAWHLAKVDDNRPAMDVYLRSSYGRIDDQALFNNSEAWSAHLGFTIYWAQSH